MTGLAGRRVLVTGGTRGIGRETVRELVGRGAHVVVAHRTPGADAEELARELDTVDGDHRVVRADVTREADADALAGVCRELWGGLDVLVNNVGADARSPLGELTEERWQDAVAVNLTSCFLVTRAVLPLLADGASVVTVGAAAARRGRPESAHYGATKSALEGLTRSLARELGPRGIRVNTVTPGVVVTAPGGGPPGPVADIIRGMTALGRLGTSRDVAGVVAFLAGDDARYVTGATIPVDGGI